MNNRILEQSPPRYRSSRGFTLIELMIVVAIVAILTTIAYPNYRDYVIRGQLVDATQGLAAVRANMERYFQDNRTYLPVGTFTPPCTAAVVAYGRFNINCAAADVDATHFKATAVGATGTLTGFTFTVNQADVQTTVVATPPAPASFQGCATAWITKTGGC